MKAAVRLYKNAYSKKTVYVAGGWGYGNLGDNAILDATLRLLSGICSDAEIVVSAYDQAEVLENHGITPTASVHYLLTRDRHSVANRLSYWLWRTLRSRRVLTAPMRRVLDQLYKADFVVLAGGGYFTDAWRSMMTAQLVMIEFADFVGTPVLICGQSLGPFHPRTARKALPKYLRKVSFIGCRDKATFELIKQSGVSPENYALTADVANTLSSDVGTRHRGDSETTIIGIMVHRLHRYMDQCLRPGSRGKIRTNNKFLNELVQAFLQLTKNKPNCYFRIIPSTNWDISFCLELYRTLARFTPHVDVVKGANLKEFVQACQTVDVMLSTNMHPLIIATTALKPCLALSYHFKVDEFMKSIGSSRYCAHIDDFTADWLSSSLAELIDNRIEISVLLREKQKLLRKMASMNFDAIAKSWTSEQA